MSVRRTATGQVYTTILVVTLAAMVISYVSLLLLGFARQSVVEQLLTVPAGAVRTGVEDEARALQQLFAVTAVVAGIATAVGAYLSVLMYVSIRGVIAWNTTVGASLASGGQHGVVTSIRPNRLFPASRVLVEQTTEIGSALQERVVEAQAAERHSAEVASQLQSTVQELVNSRDDYMRAAQLAAVGRVAGSVSHEINNPVTGVLGYLAFIRKRTSDEKVLPYVDKAYREVERIGRIARSLLVFSRHGVGAMPAPFDLIPAVDNVAALIAPQMREQGVDLVVLPAPDLPPARGRVDEFQQCLLNVLLNARDAVAGATTRSVQIEVREAAGEQAPGLEPVPGVGAGMLEVVVRDTGPGVPDDLRQRVFDPFFTTKGAGQGSGLGLSVCVELMSAMGGSIRLDEARVGACFVLAVPCAAPDPGHENGPSRVSSADALPAPGGAIL